MTEQTFITKIKNERKTGVCLYTRLGEAMEIIGPGKSRILETWNPETLYAPCSEIIYKADGTVARKANPAYPQPKSRWLLVADNVDGRYVERRIIGGREIVLLRGLPRTFAIEVDDPLAVYSRMEIIKVMERFPSVDYPNYNEFKSVLKDMFTDRPDSELEGLRLELEKMT